MAIGDGQAASDHFAPEIPAISQTADGDKPTVPIDILPGTRHGLALNETLKVLKSRHSAFCPAAGLAVLERIDAEQPDVPATHHQTVAIFGNRPATQRLRGRRRRDRQQTQGNPK